MILDPQMSKLLVEQLVTVLRHLPDHMDEDDIHDFLGGGPLEWTTLKAPEALLALGWIDGVADTHDVTLLTLLDEEEISFERLREKALPAGRRRLRRGR